MTMSGKCAAPHGAEGRAPVTRSRWAGLMALGGLFGAVSVSSCCVLPLVLFSLGAGGAWIGNLAALAPYQPVFVAITLAFLGYGAYLVRRAPGGASAGAGRCAAASSNRIVKSVMWTAAALVAVGVAFPYLAPLILDA